MKRKIIMSFLLILLVAFGAFAIFKIYKCYQYNAPPKHVSSISKDKKWTIYAVDDPKEYWDGYLIYNGNKNGNAGKISIKGTIEGDQWNRKLKPEEYWDVFKQVVPETKEKKYFYSFTELNGGIQPEMSFTIYYKESGKNRVTTVKLEEEKED